MSNSKQKYRHADTGKEQELTLAVAALFPLMQPVRLEVERHPAPASVEDQPTPSAEPTLLMEPAIVPALDSTATQAPKVARRDRPKER